MFKKNCILNLSSEHHAEQADEPDRPPVKLVLTIIIIAFIFVSFTWVAGYGVLSKYTDEETNIANYGMADPNRLDYIKHQEETLNSYKKLDNGSYQIPVSAAMTQIVEQNKK